MPQTNMQTRIRITISPDGETKVGVSGVKGKACKDLTRVLEQSLGEQVESTNTGEFYEPPAVRSIDQS